MKIALCIAYDGSHYFGWQKAAEGISIEEVLQAAVEKALAIKTHLEAASRTDRGVHAEGQVVSFDIENSAIPVKNLPRVINRFLPDSIRVLYAEEKGKLFHVSLASRSKIYRYHLSLGAYQSPLKRLYSWHCPYTLALPAMRTAARYFLGEHDFASFTNRPSSYYKNTLCYIDKITIQCEEQVECIITIEGSRFLYKMVRNLVACLVSVGRGKLSPDQIPDILKSRKRRNAGSTSPAHGLCLLSINFQGECINQVV